MQKFIINGCLSGDFNIKRGVSQWLAPGPLLSSCYMQPLEGKQPELTKTYHFNADDTVAYFVFDLTLSPCMFDDILIPIQCRSSNAKLNFEADNRKYMIIQKSKNAKHGLLRPVF